MCLVHRQIVLRLSPEDAARRARSITVEVEDVAKAVQDALFEKASKRSSCCLENCAEGDV